MKPLLRSIILVFLGITTYLNSNAHGVQVAYCASCKDLTIYIEHWHGTAQDTGTMTIQILTATGTFNYTIAPTGYINNTTLGNLPCPGGTATTIGSCTPQANTYNDWNVYTLPGVGCGQQIAINVISGNSIIVTDCGSMYPISTPAIQVPCDTTMAPITPVSDQAVCEGSAFSATSFPPFPGYSYNWTNSDPSIGLASSGTGNIAGFIASQVPSTRTAIISVTRGCADTTFSYTVYDGPSPTYTNSLTCDGDTMYFQHNTSPSITKRYWDFENNSTINDSVVSTSYVFPGPGNQTVRLEATDTNGCVGTSVTQVFIHPKPVAAFTHSDTVCLGGIFNLTDASSISSGSIASWDWDINNDNSIEYTSQNTTHSFGTAGNYQVELLVTSNAGCKDSIISSIEVVSCAGIAENQLGKLHLYPNPASNLFAIDLNDVSGNQLTVDILTIEGKKVSTAKVSARTLSYIDVSPLAVGTYMVVLSKDGDVTHRSRLSVLR